MIFDYQLQIPLHFSNAIKTEPCKYRLNLLKQATIMFILFVRNLLYNLMASPSSVETNAVDSLNISEHHSETETDKQSEETTDSAQQSVQSISKKNTKSLTWKYFGFTPDEDGKPINYSNLKCKLCCKDISPKFDNTSNLLKPLHHRNKFSKISHAQAAELRLVKSSGKDKFTQPTLQACFKQSKKYSTSLKEHQRLSNVVTNFIVQDVMPIYTVEKHGFCTMVEALNPRNQLPHKDFFSRTAIPELYERTHKQVAVKAKKESQYYLATTNLWSLCTSDPYLYITIHYIDSEWNLQSHWLQANYMPEDHTGEHLQNAFSTSFTKRGLDTTKLVAIATDNGSNIKLACELLSWMCVSCFSHNLDLAINKGISDPQIDRVIGLCRKVVSSFSYIVGRDRRN